MSQSKKQSTIEAVVNIIVGNLVAVGVNQLVLPLMGFDITIEQNLFLAVFFSIVSFLRSYTLRRFFNYINDR